MKLGFEKMNKNHSKLNDSYFKADERNSYYIYRPKVTYTYKNPNVGAKFVSEKEIGISGGYV